jgi:hypothetical protein
VRGVCDDLVPLSAPPPTATDPCDLLTLDELNALGAGAAYTSVNSSTDSCTWPSEAFAGDAVHVAELALAGIAPQDSHSAERGGLLRLHPGCR